MQTTPALWYVLDTFPMTLGLEPIMHSPKPLSFEDATILKNWLESHRCLTGKPECFELCEA
jgi:hypothetical protein